MRKFPLLVGALALLTVGCVIEPRESIVSLSQPKARAMQPAPPPIPAPAATPAPRKAATTPGGNGAMSAKEELAVLKVEAGALITQVNGDPKLRCTRPDCNLPLPPGTHRFSVLYRDTATRQGSTVTYAAMYPRVIEVTLEPGHRYTVSASGRYSRNWWIAVEDRTTNEIVYDDRTKPE